MKRNLAVSVRMRLLTLSKERGMVYNQALVRYALEGLLLRLSLSRHADRFILKGAMLYVLWQPDAPPRATQDLDLLCFGRPEPAFCLELFEEIAQVELDEPDGLKFDNVSATPIRLEDLYGGIRVNLTAHLDTARIPLQVDLGFGDRPVPEAQRHQYPALLREQKPQLRVYAQETVIAEKLHAMVERGLANSRAKDFFDISYLAKHFPFECPTLSAAIQSTFERRGRALPTAEPIVAWTPQFYDDPVKQSQWTAFLRKAGLSAEPLPNVMAQIESFLHLPFELRPTTTGYARILATRWSLDSTQFIATSCCAARRNKTRDNERRTQQLKDELARQSLRSPRNGGIPGRARGSSLASGLSGRQTRPQRVSHETRQ